MTLDPGFYKIQRGDGNYKTYHYWKVYLKNGVLCLVENNSVPIPINDEDRIAQEMEGVKILKNYQGKKPPECHGLKITLSFKDEDGHTFNFGTRNKFAFKAIFEKLPWLRRAFQ